MQRGDMNPDVFQQVFTIILESASEADLQRMVDEIQRRKGAAMQRERRRLLNEYRDRWYPQLRGRPAAEAIERDLARLSLSGLWHRSAPALSDPKLAQAFQLLTSGPLLSADRIRKLFHPVG